MAELAIITPSRGRAERFAYMLEMAFKHAADEIEVWAGVDHDDDIAAYRAVIRQRSMINRPVFIRHDARRSLSAWTNDLARMALESPDPPRYFASLGDDHVPRSPQWDRKLIDAIEEHGGSGWAYGNDFIQGVRLPTAWVVSADIVRALGWLMLPSLAHMYVDNAILALGQALNRIIYVPGVIIEHVHPVAGKAAMDDSYRESNSAERYQADFEAFEAWQLDGLAKDVATVRAMLGKEAVSR